ncbi:MAG: prepilin-type N-terminal cleavage/methylation domain-containing protein [Planctomycetota bacterium]|jgi:prepilin-type N-terminal cleavage/methylation domain-containing protein
MKNTRYKAGLTIVELLIALAVVAMLLTAVAVAFNASAVNYEQNEDIFRTINSARQALFRMTSQLRTASAVKPDPNSPAECTMITAGGEDITYRYNGADNKLYLITNDDLTDSDYVLCENVTALNCKKTLTDDGLGCKSVQITITVQSGDVKQTVSGAAAIRRNLN